MNKSLGLLDRAGLKYMNLLRRNSKLDPNLKRFVSFCLIGGSGVVVDMTVLFLLTDARMLAWGLYISKILAAEAAIFNNFVWNNVWTFRDVSGNQTEWRAYFQRFAKFNLICLVGIGFNLLFLKAQINFLQMNLYVANFVAIFLVSVWNFWMSTKFGWINPCSAGRDGSIGLPR
jgi:dolichol-phosphate mannosyltransferase